MHCDLDIQTFDLKANMANPWLMGSVPVKFHEDRCKGEAVMRIFPLYLTMRLQTDSRQTDGRADGRGDSSIPPPLSSLRGGITNRQDKNSMPPIIQSGGIKIAF